MKRKKAKRVLGYRQNFFIYKESNQRFNKSSFQSEKVKGKTTLNKNKESIVAVAKSPLLVVQKMLANGKLVKNIMLGATINFEGPRKTVEVSKGKTNKTIRLGDVLFNTLLQALGRAISRGAGKFFSVRNKAQNKGTFVVLEKNCS